MHDLNFSKEKKKQIEYCFLMYLNKFYKDEDVLKNEIYV